MLRSEADSSVERENWHEATEATSASSRSGTYRNVLPEPEPGPGERLPLVSCWVVTRPREVTAPLRLSSTERSAAASGAGVK